MEEEEKMNPTAQAQQEVEAANSESVRSLAELIKKSPPDMEEIRLNGTPSSVSSMSDVTPTSPLTSPRDTHVTEAQVEQPPVIHTVPSPGAKPKKSCLKIRITKVDEDGLTSDPLTFKPPTVTLCMADGEEIDELPPSPVVSPGSLRVRKDSLALSKLNIDSRNKRRRFVKPPEYKLKIAVAIMFVVIVTSVAVIVHFYHKQQHVMTLAQRIVFDDYRRHVTVKRDNDILMTGTWGRNMAPGVTTYDCTLTSPDLDPDLDLCLQWSKQGHVVVHETPVEGGECYSVTWLVQEGWPDPHDCFSLEGAQWYGGSLLWSQRLSLGNTSVPLSPYLTASVHKDMTFGPVLDRMWISSKGVAIFVDDDTPLHVSVNAPLDNNQTDASLCLRAQYKNSPYQNPQNKPPNLKYTICLAENAREVHKLVNVTAFDLDAVPDGSSLEPEVFRKPVWSTWAYFKDNITQELVLDYARAIAEHGYERHLLGVDEGWEQWQSDLQFNTSSFPNATSMLSDLGDLGFRVSLQVHPYINVHSRLFPGAVSGDYLVLDQSRAAPGLVRWYNGPRDAPWDRGVAAVTDMHPRAAAWWGAQLDTLLTSLGDHVTGFRYDMGEINQLPFNPAFGAGYDNPNMYTHAYSVLAAEHGDYPQIRAAYRAQGTPAFVRIYDKSSTWGQDNGLQTLVPTAVTLGILGYPFIMADSVGGAAYRGFPSRELYIRWMQVTAFLPVMHFSIPPHHYDDQVVTLAKELIKIHEEVVYPEVALLVANSSYPLVRALWWPYPADSAASWLEDEFMVGERLLVAPVLTEHARDRDIYLPEGRWINQVTMVTHTGPAWLNVQVPLEKIVYFIKKG